MSIWAVSMWGHRVVLLWTFLLMSFGHKSAHFSLDACLVVVQSLSHVWLFETPWNAACQASLSFTIPQSLFKLMSFDLVMPTNHLILCRPLPLLPSIFPSIRIFSNESVLRIRWPKYWSFSFSISPSNEYSGLISFRMDWFDLLASPGNSPDLHFLLKGTLWPYNAVYCVN